MFAYTRRERHSRAPHVCTDTGHNLRTFRPTFVSEESLSHSTCAASEGPSDRVLARYKTCAGEGHVDIIIPSSNQVDVMATFGKATFNAAKYASS